MLSDREGCMSGVRAEKKQGLVPLGFVGYGKEVVSYSKSNF